MRVLVAPDKFAGTLTAVEAARAIAEGWARQAPDDELDLAPMADGGPGFVDVLHAALGGELSAVTVTGPHGEPVPGAVLRVGERAYVESAQACGLALTGGERAESATTWGVGELVMHAIEAGATDIVVGLGGSGTNDGGAGLLGALGATADRPLDAGAAALAGVTAVDLGPAAGSARRASAGAGQRRRQPADRAVRGHQDLRPAEGDRRRPAARRRRRASRSSPRPPTAVRPWRRARAPPAVSGSRCCCWAPPAGPGSTSSPRPSPSPARARAADLVVTGEGAFDFSSRSGKVPYGVATVAAEALRPCVALAGRVLVGSREMRALGIESAYSLVDLVGEERALADPAAQPRRPRRAGGPHLVALSRAARAR